MTDIVQVNIMPKLGKESNILSFFNECYGTVHFAKNASGLFCAVANIARQKVPQLEKILENVDLLFMSALYELETTLKPHIIDVAGNYTHIYAPQLVEHDSGSMSGNGSCAQYIGTVDPKIDDNPYCRYLLQKVKPRFVREGLQAAVTTHHEHIKNTEGFQKIAGVAYVLLNTARNNHVMQELLSNTLEVVVPKTYHQLFSFFEGEGKVEYSALNTLLMTHYQSPTDGLSDHIPTCHDAKTKTFIDVWLQRQFDITYETFFRAFSGHQCIAK